jgi:thiamine monophosphate kinase
MAGGDWRFLYCVPKSELHALGAICGGSETLLTVVGEITDTGGIWIKTLGGKRRKVRLIEHDSFTSPADGKSYFEFLSDPQELFE